jgi:hypothetical protein
MTTMETARVDMLLRFLTEDLDLSRAELLAMRSAIDARLRCATPTAAPSSRRTLYFPSDRLGALSDEE